MATHTADFWPDDIGQSDLRTPLALLREQAVALGEKTKNVVTAAVESSSDGDSFVHQLYITAPGMNYKYQLLVPSYALPDDGKGFLKPRLDNNPGGGRFPSMAQVCPGIRQYPKSHKSVDCSIPGPVKDLTEYTATDPDPSQCRPACGAHIQRPL
jgi:hypothetical protein